MFEWVLNTPPQLTSLAPFFEFQWNHKVTTSNFKFYCVKPDNTFRKNAQS